MNFDVTITPLRTACKLGSINAISAKATGNAPLTYQWRKGGVDIEGERSDTLFFPSLTANDLATYTVMVTTPNGSVESNAVTLKLDSDGDSLPDDWELEYFDDLTRRAEQDSDGDGSTNEEELADNTDPDDAASARFAITLLRLPGGAVTVNPPGLRPLKGSTVTFTATPDSGLFRSWTGSVSGATPELTVTINAPLQVGAIFDEVVTWGGLAARPTPPSALGRVTALSVGSGVNVAFDTFDGVTGWPSPWFSSAGIGGDTASLGATFDRVGRVTSLIQPIPSTVGQVVKLRVPGAVVLSLNSKGVLSSWSATQSLGVPMGIYSDIAAIQGGGIALKLDGTVISWGSFVPRPPLTLNGVKAIAAGFTHCVALKRDGTVVCWGDSNTNGQLNVPAGLSNVIAISAGAYHTLALKADGTVVAWGRNNRGQTTIPANAAQAVAISAADDDSGVVVASPNAIHPDLSGPSAAIAGVGSAFSYTLMAKGSPGSFTTSPLPAGLSFDAASRTLSGTPTMSGDYNVRFAATNTHASAYKTLNLHVLPQPPMHAWGLSGPAFIPGDLKQVTSFDSGLGFSIFALKDGSFRYGGNYNTTIAPPPGLGDVVGVAAGGQHIAVLRRNGTVLNWGNSTLAAKAPAWLHDAVQVDVGVGHVLALRANGSVAAWGGTAIANAPTSGIVQVTAFGAWGMALTSAGTVHSWGPPFIPGTPPAGLNGVIKLSASENHALALKSNGTVVGWGQNNHGQTTIPAGLADVVDILAAGNFSMALRRNGQLVSWGRTAWSTTEGVVPSPDMPPGLALTGEADHVVMLTASEPSTAVPYMVMPCYLLAHAGAPWQTRVIAQNSPSSYSAHRLPQGLVVDPVTGVVSGTPLLPGSYPVRFSATNASGTGTQESTLIVAGTINYAQWAAAKGLAGVPPTEDSDGDGASNLAEYALGSDPHDSDWVGGVRGPALPGGAQGIAFDQQPTRTDITYEVQVSTDLVVWTPVARGAGGTAMVDLLGSGGVNQKMLSPAVAEVAVLASDPAEFPRQFMRLSMTLNP